MEIEEIEDHKIEKEMYCSNYESKSMFNKACRNCIVCYFEVL